MLIDYNKMFIAIELQRVIGSNIQYRCNVGQLGEWGEPMPFLLEKNAKDNAAQKVLDKLTSIADYPEILLKLMRPEMLSATNFHPVSVFNELMIIILSSIEACVHHKQWVMSDDGEMNGDNLQTGLQAFCYIC